MGVSNAFGIRSAGGFTPNFGALPRPSDSPEFLDQKNRGTG